MGREGERRAVSFLKKKGYKILGKNLKNRFAEIDVLAYKNGVYCFCEVKTRTSDLFGTPAEAVDRRKILKYRNFAQNYMEQNGLDEQVEFIVIEVTPQGVNLIENAF